MTSPDENLNFKPLSEGLGFHLFADGLPYAPRTSSTTGTGATVAGKSSFAFPEKKIETRSTEQATQQIQRELENLKAQLQRQRPPMPLTQQIPNAAERISRELAGLESNSLGYVLKRTFAYGIDFLFMGSICSAILSIALLKMDVKEITYLSLETVLTFGLFLFSCIWASIAAQEVAFGTSVGKRIFNLRLPGTGMEVFFRAVFFIPSLFFCGLGILMALTDSRKRCWHDRVSQIQPVSE